MHPGILSFLFLIGMLAAKASPTIKQCLKGPFQGITETDTAGNVIGKSDPRDWGCAPSSAGGPPAPLSTLDVPGPAAYELCLTGAYPNPVQGNAVRITFTVPSPTPTPVRITIYGQERGHGKPEVFPVRVVADHTLSPGFFESVWDLRDDQGALVPPGIYRVVLEGQGEALCGDIEIP